MNKRALITGGSRGIGAAIARTFAARGYSVVLTYQRNPELGQEVANSIVDEYKTRCEAVQCDVRDFDQARACVARTLKLLDGIDVLVNNAGITRDQGFMTMAPDEWRDVIDTNLTGAFNMSRAVVTTLLGQRSGSVINVSSVAGCIGLAGMANYAASKAGLHGFTRSLAKECAPRNVTVNAVAPGFIETDMLAKLEPGYRDRVKEQIPLRRFGSASEVAALVHFLTTEESRYVTGQVFVVDGGVSL